MNVDLGPVGLMAQAQLEGFKSRALRNAPVRAARDSYVTRWRRAEAGKHNHTDGSTKQALVVLGGIEAHRDVARQAGDEEALSLKDDALSRWSALVVASPAPAAISRALGHLESALAQVQTCGVESLSVWLLSSCVVQVDGSDWCLSHAGMWGFGRAARAEGRGAVRCDKERDRVEAQ